MLLLFLFSIMPRLYLHDLFAHHVDTVCFKEHQGEKQLHKSTYNCNTHDQVAESPFTHHAMQVKMEPPLRFPTTTTQHLITNLRLQVPATTDLRGPPAIA